MTPDDIRVKFADLWEVASEDLQCFLDSASEIDIPAKTRIIAPNKESKTLYLIYSGLVRVSLETEGLSTVLGELGSGQWFGETGVIEPAVSIASVTAVEDCTVLTVSHDEFMAMRRQCPALTSTLLQLFSSNLTDRLRSTIQFIDTGVTGAPDKDAGNRWYAEVAKHIVGLVARTGA